MILVSITALEVDEIDNEDTESGRSEQKNKHSNKRRNKPKNKQGDRNDDRGMIFTVSSQKLILKYICIFSVRAKKNAGRKQTAKRTGTRGMFIIFSFFHSVNDVAHITANNVLEVEKRDKDSRRKKKSKVSRAETADTFVKEYDWSHNNYPKKYPKSSDERICLWQIDGYEQDGSEDAPRFLWPKINDDKFQGPPVFGNNPNQVDNDWWDYKESINHGTNVFLPMMYVYPFDICVCTLLTMFDWLISLPRYIEQLFHAGCAQFLQGEILEGYPTAQKRSAQINFKNNCKCVSHFIIIEDKLCDLVGEELIIWCQNCHVCYYLMIIF